MNALICPLLALVAIAAANPVAAAGQGLNNAAGSSPVATPAPTLVRRDGPSVTTIPVSSCINYADPSSDDQAGCYCSGYASLLPYLTTGTDSCGYTDLVTATGSANGYPFTKTESNAGVTAWATTTVYPGGGDWYGAGESTVLLAGTSLSLQMDPTSYANIGTVTSSGSALFTAVSSAIASACPPPSNGATVTQCSAEAKVTGLDYIDADALHHDGTLDIDIPIISVSDPNVLTALISFIAAGIQSNSQSPNNTNTITYLCDEANLPCQDYENAMTVDLVNVPAVLQAIYTEETEETKGNPLFSNLEVSMKMVAGPSDFSCSDAGTALSIIAAVGSVIPGLGWLGGGVVGSVGRAGLSLVCNLEGSSNL